MTDRELLLELQARVERIEAGNEQILAALSRLSPEPRLSRRDRALLVHLLPALYVAFSPASFRTGEVLHKSPVLHAICADRSAKSLGKLFSRSVGTFINGYRLERFGKEGNAGLWKVTSLGVSGITSDVKAA